MRLQRHPRGGIGARVGQRRKQRQHLLPRRVVQTRQAGQPRLKAFGPGPVGADDLVIVKHHMQIADRAPGRNPRHPGPVQHVNRRNQHLVFAKEQLRARARHQHPVLWRHGHRAVGRTLTQGTLGDPDRGIGRIGCHLVRRQIAPADPAQRQIAVVPRQNQIAGPQAFDRDLALPCRDPRAGGETGDDLFDVGEPHRSGARHAVEFVKGHRPVFPVARVIEDIRARKPETGQVQNVGLGPRRVFAAVRHIADAAEYGVAARPAGDRVRPVAAGQQIIAVAARQRVQPRAAGDGVVPRVAGQHIVAGAAVDQVGAVTARHRIVAVARVDGVVARLAVDCIVARVAPDQVAVRPAAQRVIARTTGNRVDPDPAVDAVGIIAARQAVIAIAARQRVQPRAAGDGVVPRIPRQHIVARVAGQRIGPVAAGQAVVAGPARQRIVARPAGQHIGPVTARQAVIPVLPQQRVIAEPAKQAVGAGAAVDVVGIGRRRLKMHVRNPDGLLRIRKVGVRDHHARDRPRDLIQHRSRHVIRDDAATGGGDRVSRNRQRGRGFGDHHRNFPALRVIGPHRHLIGEAGRVDVRDTELDVGHRRFDLRARRRVEIHRDGGT